MKGLQTKSRKSEGIQGFYSGDEKGGDKGYSQYDEGRKAGLELKEPMGLTHRRDLGKEPMECRGAQNFLELIHSQLGEMNIYKLIHKTITNHSEVCKRWNWGIVGSHPKCRVSCLNFSA